MRNRVKNGPPSMKIAQLWLIIGGLLVFGLFFSDRDQAAAAEPNAAYVFPEDASRGWRLFLSKNCIHCHAIWGQGQGTIGPDLGRIHISHQSQGMIATNLVNHLPTMWDKMREEGIQYKAMDAQEMADLFAFLYFVRYVDEPGDPKEGKNLLSSKGCTTCHSIQGEGGKIGPDLTRWGIYINPIVWAQKMWDHAPQMEAEMQKKGMVWPMLNAQEMVNLVAYIQSIGGKIQEEHHLAPGSPMKGRELFRVKGCIECHSIEGEGAAAAPDFGKIEFPRTLAGMAALMWNHSPSMMQMMKMRNIPRQKMDAQEMADILSYLFAIRFLDPPGDPDKGAKIFEEKNCVICHAVGSGGRDGSIGPNLGRLGDISVIHVSNAIWNHGPAMMSRMREYGFSWPVLGGTDLNDIIAYLKASGKGGK